MVNLKDGANRSSALRKFLRIENSKISVTPLCSFDRNFAIIRYRGFKSLPVKCISDEILI